MIVEEAAVGAICSAIIDYRGKTPPKAPAGIPLLTAKVIKDGTIDKSRLEYISEETYEWWMRRGLPREGDVLITTEAPLGETAILRGAERVALAQRVILLRGNPEVVDQRYLFSAIRSPLVQGRLRQRATGTTVLGIKQRELRQVLIPLPSLRVQRKIAAVVSPYDDLLENNRERIELLEESAKRMFGEWFVDLRYPGHESCDVTECELGPIPTSWSLVRLDEVASVVDCLHSKKPAHDPSGPGVLLQLDNIRDDGLVDLSQRYLISAEDYFQWTSRMELTKGDCVITNVGRIGAVGQIPPGERAAAGRNMTGVRPTRLTPTFLLQYLLSDHMKREVQRKKDAGSIMDSLNVKGIVRLAVPLPPIELMERFESTARPVRREMENLLLATQHLRASRDVLLPRLVSGQIRVDDLAIEAAVA